MSKGFAGHLERRGNLHSRDLGCFYRRSRRSRWNFGHGGIRPGWGPDRLPDCRRHRRRCHRLTSGTVGHECGRPVTDRYRADESRRWTLDKGTSPMTRVFRFHGPLFSSGDLPTPPLAPRPPRLGFKGPETLRGRGSLDWNPFSRDPNGTPLTPTHISL